MPVIFEPIFVPKPWGGRALAQIFDKRLPDGAQIGESWEVASLPGVESRVAAGPLAGHSLADLVEAWGPALLGDAALVEGRFPLLVKFLDAREHLSVQVHPRPPLGDPTGMAPGVKHECWYVVRADGGAQVYIGLRDGVAPADLERCMGTRALVDFLEPWPARAGDFFHLPSGTLHALGRGVVVAEIQTPSDTTYRAYDWDHLGPDGRPRELHAAEAFFNTRFDVTRLDIQPPAAAVGSENFLQSELLAGARMRVVHAQPLNAGTFRVRHGEMRVWVVLRGRMTLRGAFGDLPIRAGDAALLPAGAEQMQVTVGLETEWLEASAGTL